MANTGVFSTKINGASPLISSIFMSLALFCAGASNSGAAENHMGAESLWRRQLEALEAAAAAAAASQQQEGGALYYDTALQADGAGGIVGGQMAEAMAEDPQVFDFANADQSANQPQAALLPQEFTDKNDDSTFFELSPEIGQTSGLAIDAKNNLVLFHRSARVWDEYSFTANNKLNKSLGLIENSTIAILDPKTGRLLEKHGASQFYMPHGLTVDSNGSYWLTDVGSHQVIKLDKDFKPLLELGEKLVPGSDEKHFCKPTDVAVAKNGDFFVADGYCNSRIMKFNKDGKLLTSFGMPNYHNPPKIGEFLVPHSLALIEDLNLLCVADRENKRIQCFAAGLTEGAHYHPRAFVPTGTFFTKAENIGRVFAIREKHHYLVGVTNHDESEQIDPQVFVMDMNSGRANTFAKGLENAHALALSDDGDIFISQINPNQIVKFSVPDQE